MAVKGLSKTLAVYVIGMSGSMDYVGCGKSSLCQQFVYDEYMGESCSTLLQSEFDSDVINRRHSIYWGQKKKIYMNESSDSITVDFDIFEHTIFYEDGTNLPYPGHQNYEKRVFTPLKTYANAYAFKSRDEVLSPEAYGNKRFLYSKDIPVAYLYVMDVSEPFYAFNEQLEMMNKLVKSIQKKHCCVVVASKFDIHSRGSVERLEIHANNLKVPVIHCSAKFNTNVHTAFKNLAVKALSLKRIVDDKLTPKKAHPRRPLSSIFSRKASPKMDVNDQLSNDIHLSPAVPTIPPRTGSKTLPSKGRNSFENPSTDELSKRRSSDHSITLPVTYYQNIFDFKSKSKHTNLSTSKSGPSSAVPTIPPRTDSKTLPSKGKNSFENPSADELSKRCSSVGNTTLDHSITLPVTYYQNIFDFKSKSKHTNLSTSESDPSSSFQMNEEADSDFKPAMPKFDMPCTLLSIQQSSNKLDRSSMPLPPTPLDAVTSNDSKVGNIQQSTENPPDAVTSNDSGQGGIQQSSEKLDRSSMPLPPTPLDDITSTNSSQGGIQQSSEKLDRSSMPLPPTPLDAITLTNSSQGGIQQSSEKLDRSSMPLPPTPLDAVTSTNSSQGGIQQSQNSERLDRSSPLDAVTSNNSKEGNIQQSTKNLLDAVTTTNSEQGSTQQSSVKLDRSSMPLPPTPLDVVTTCNSKNNLPTSPFAIAPVEVEGNTSSEDKNMNNGTTDDTRLEEYSSSSDGYERIDLLDFPEKQWSPLPSATNDTAATVKFFNVVITTADGENCIATDTEINGNKQADTGQNVASATITSTNNLPSSTLEVTPASATVNEDLLPTADMGAAKDHETAICLDTDYVISDYEFYSMQKQQQTSAETTDSNADVSVYLELKCLNPDVGNYILMHKVDSRTSTRPLQTYAYDYVFHPYIEMCRRKLRQSGVPPRRVKREGHTPSVSVNSNTIENYVSYVNVARLHDTTFLPPRGNDVTVFPKEQSDFHPVMPPRNISRNGCYLSAPSAIPM